MKAKNGFSLRPLGDEFILIAESAEWVNFNCTISMNETAAYLWRNICDGREFDTDTLCQLLLDEYDVDRETAMAAATETTAAWRDVDIITD